jgi:multicomponent Na+:H+ antiporter subunit F
MNVTASPLIAGSAQLGLFILTLSMVLVIYRMVRGPKQADRVIALDLLAILVVALVSLYAVFSSRSLFLDVALAYALVAFLGTAAFARYIERSAANTCSNLNDPHQGENHD